MLVSKQQKLVVGVFDHLQQAEQAILELWQAGFPHDRIDMITRSEGQTAATPRFERNKEAAQGAVAGAAVGATAGALAGALAMVLIPGLGIALGSGLLVSTIGGELLAGALGGGALGAAGGTFLGPFLALEMSSDEAHYYATEVDEGRTVVLVQDEHRAAEAEAILKKHGARLRTAAPAAARSV
jgi:hypothetical protein